MKKTKALIVYTFFPHYRKGVIEKIVSCLPNSIFMGSMHGLDGINVHDFGETNSFVPIQTFYIKKFILQPRIILECLVGSYSSYIFLANPNILTTWIGAAICRIRGRRVIFWGHGFKSSEKTTKNIFRSAFFHLANGFYSYGWRGKKNAEKMGFDVNSIYVGFNSLDYDLQLSFRKKYFQYSSCVTESELHVKVLCISRLTKICRYDVLFEAVALVRAKYGIQVQVKVIGDGPEMSSLKSHASTLEIYVDFIGALYAEEQIASYLYAADVTVSPGKVGLTAMHSMMYGTPVISHDDFENQMPEVEAIVPGYTGYLFKKDNVADLAEKLRDFKGEFPDRELTRQRCFSMIDKVYNPTKQVEILTMAIQGIPAPMGNDAFVLFDEEAQP